MAIYHLCDVCRVRMADYIVEVNDQRRTNMIKPTVGRVVWYQPLPSEPGYGNGYLAAIIAKVNDDDNVNLMVIDTDGSTYGRERTTLWNGVGYPPTSFCQWMPYQLGQAAKAEEAEAKLKEATGE